MSFQCYCDCFDFENEYSMKVCRNFNDFVIINCNVYFGLLKQSVLDMAGFRSLGENEEVDFTSKQMEKGAEATMVTGPNKTSLQGSKSHGKTKKHFRKTRLIINNNR